jgi:hypothetical protein
MGGTRILSDEQLDEMVELRESGRSIQQIADHFTALGTVISAGSINWQLTRLGIYGPKGLGRLPQARSDFVRRAGHTVRLFTPEEDEQLLELEASGENYSAIAKKVGRKPNSIRGRLYTLARREAAIEADEVRS